jgi:hypothetical protein
MSVPAANRPVLVCAVLLAALLASPVCAQSDTPPPESEPLDLSKLDPSIDWSVLDTDASSLVLDGYGGRSITIVPTARQKDLTKWNKTENRDGTAAVTVKRSLPTAWDTKVGLDLGLAPTPSPLRTPERLVAGPASESRGVAWVSTTGPGLNLPIGWDKTSITARFDPIQEESKFGTRFSRSLPINQDVSVTMESGIAVTHLRNQPLPNELASKETNVFDAERMAKLNFLATGTSIGAGSRKSSIDDIWLNSLSAEQKLFGGVSITGSVSETLEGETNKSVTAGFRRTW